ncbi:hypothetical protein P7C71_g3963, partial [Lecanoromycetidae sp. Uapishka_2]
MNQLQSGVDSDENIRKFIAKMNRDNSNKGSPAQGGSAEQVKDGSIASNSNTATLEEPIDQQNEHDITNGDENSLTRVAQPIPIPERLTARVAASTEVHPIPSPHVSGLLAPQNTPYARPMSPIIMATEVKKHNEEVGGALSDFVNKLEGKPLSESYWAPAKVAARAVATRAGSPTISKKLTPLSVVTPNPAINDTFERMSFKAADTDRKVGGNIFGDRNTRSALINPGSKQPSLSAVLTAKSPPGPKEPDELADAGVSSPSGGNVATKATNRVDRTLSKAGSAIVDSQEAKPPATDNLLLTNLRAIEESGDLSSDQIAFLKTVTHQVVAKDKGQPIKATEADKPAGVPTKVNGAKSTMESTGNVVGQAAQTEVLIKNLRHKENELKDLNALNAAAKAAVADSEKDLRLKEKALEDYDAIRAGKEAKLEEEITDLRTELTRLQALIEELDIKKKELKALDASNAGEGAQLVRVIQDARHELRVKNSAKENGAMYDRKHRELEREIEELRAELQTTMAAKMTSKGKVPTIAADPVQDEEDLEHKTFFTTWPQSERRGRAPAKNRKVILKNLPSNADLSFVASIVYFGPVEAIYMRSDNTATVKFLNAADCQKYYDDTSNGIVYGKDVSGREKVVFVELAKDVDVIGGLLQGWIDVGASRCVRLVSVEEEWGMVAMKEFAEKKGRVLEKMSDGKTPGGIDHAVVFKAWLARDEEFDHCNINFAADPCEKATGVHF